MPQYSLNLAWASSLEIKHLLTPSIRLCLHGSYVCVPGGKLSCLKGKSNQHWYPQMSRLPQPWDLQDVLGIGTFLLAHLAWGHTDLWWFGRIRAGHDVPDFQCRHVFWDSNSWTALAAGISYQLCVQISSLGTHFKVACVGSNSGNIMRQLRCLIHFEIFHTDSFFFHWNGMVMFIVGKLAL